MKKKFLGKIITGILALIIVAVGISFSQKAKAATFSMQTGYYVGSGNTISFSGLGFTPQLVIIKADTTAGVGGVWKSSVMPANDTAFFSTATADDTTGLITLDSNGFTLSGGADVNTIQVRYTYIAFAGSDCSSTGTFCIGSYTGNGTTGHAITSVGFQPDLVWVKKADATAEIGVWRSSAMATNVTQFFSATAQNTGNTYIQSFSSTGFTIGTALDVNVSAKTYWFAAFKDVAGSMNVGSFAGSGIAQSITGMGFQPNFVIYKSSGAESGGSGYELTQSDGDDSSLFTDTKDTPGNITSLDADGFSVGTTAGANASGTTIYYAGFGGDVPASASAAGEFVEADGSYTGNGTGQSMTGLSFSPDLVIIGTASEDNVFRTSEMNGDDTAVFSNATADFTGGITSLDPSGFTVGTASTTNLSGATYYWIAFGNAWSQETHTGSADFVVGAYTGNGFARSILNLPFAPDFVLTKSETTYASNWTTSAMPPGTTNFLSATAQNTAGAEFASLNTNSFSIGTNNNANKSGVVYNWFGFKDDERFATGNYTGNGTGQTVSGLGFQPDLIWAKRTTAVAGTMTFSSVPVGTSLVFGVSANSTVDIVNLTNDGFTVGTGAQANTSGGAYWYAAWEGKVFNQSAYRFYANQNSTDVGTPLAAQNTSVTLTTTGELFRLRMLIQQSNDTLFEGGGNLKLQFASSTVCSSATYSDVTTSTAIAYYNNSTPVGGSALTANANDPINGTDVIDNQSYDESNPFTNDQSAINDGEDGKWDFSLIDNGASPSTAYCFRAIRNSGVVLESYAQYPQIVTASSVSSPSISNIILNGGNSIVLTPNATTAVTLGYKVSDYSGSGCSDIFTAGHVTSTAFLDTVSSTCKNTPTANNLNCYITTLAGSTNSCGGSTSTNATATDTLYVYYLASSSGVPSSSYPSDHWYGYVGIASASGATSTGVSSAVDVNALTAFAISTSSINFGLVKPGTNTGATNKTFIISNAGNTSSTFIISGVNFIKGVNSFAITNEHFSSSSFIFGGGEQSMGSLPATISGLLLTAPTTTASTPNGTIYFGLAIPSATPTGTYTSSNTISAIFSN